MKKEIISYVKKILIILLAIFVWQSLYWIFSLKGYLLPPPLEIIQTFYEALLSGEIIKHVLVSLRRVIVGFAMAGLAGILLGLILGYYKKLGEYISPLIEIMRPIPPIAWIPIAILFFGLGDTSSYFIVFLGAFFPVFTNTFFGVTSLPEIHKNVALSFEINRLNFFKNILFFSSLPNIFAGLKISIGMAWMSVIAAELIGAQSGLGYYIQLNRLISRTDKILVGMILIGILGYLLNKILRLLEAKIIPWHKSAR